MPILNSFYAWLLALAAYGTIDFNDYQLLHTNENGFSFYLDETDNFIVKDSIDNHLRVYHQTKLGTSTMNLEEFFIGIQSIDGSMIAGVAFFIMDGMSGGVKSDKKCFVHNIWVDEEYRNRGIGKFLMQKVQNYVQKQGIFEITTESFQIDQSHDFFKKIGFRDLVTNPSPEGLSGHDIYCVMKKQIDVNEDQKDLTVNDFDLENYTMYQGSVNFEWTLLGLLQQGALFSSTQVQKYFKDFTSNLFSTDQAEQYALTKQHVQNLNEKLKNYRELHGASKIEDDFTIFIVSSDGKIVGGAIGNVQNFSYFGNWCYIDGVAIDADYRKHSLGRELFKQVDLYAKSKECKYLELWTGEWQARGFYEKVGFEVVTTFPRSEHVWNQEGYYLRKYLE